MKAILEFTLPEESMEHEWALHGADYLRIVELVDERCRSWIKHGNDFKQPEELAQAVRDIIIEEKP